MVCVGLLLCGLVWCLWFGVRCLVLYGVVSCGMVWCGGVWCSIVGCGVVVWHMMVWFDMVLILFNVVSYIVLYGII